MLCTYNLVYGMVISLTQRALYDWIGYSLPVSFLSGALHVAIR